MSFFRPTLSMRNMPSMVNVRLVMPITIDCIIAPSRKTPDISNRRGA